MKTSILATLTAEGYTSQIVRHFDEVTGIELVTFRADLDIDDDGANGQHGLPVAYRRDNKGRERLADVGYPRDPDEYSEGLICHPGTRTPIDFDGMYASRTALRMPGFGSNDPRVGVDAEYFPYVVVPPIVRSGTIGKVLGCFCEVINHANGKQCTAVVADIGPYKKNGEGSPALARAVGIPDDPLSGGTDDAVIEYIVHVGVPATINGIAFALQ